MSNNLGDEIIIGKRIAFQSVSYISNSLATRRVPIFFKIVKNLNYLVSNIVTVNVNSWKLRLRTEDSMYLFS